MVVGFKSEGCCCYYYYYYISSSSNLLFVQLESLLIIYFSVSPIKMKRGDGDVTFFLIYPTGRYHSEYSDAHRYFSRFPIGSYWCYGDQ